jgi:inorganic pyrophosphatase
VTVDRPVGFHHVTRGIHLDYTINYGFLPGVIGGDGEEQDVYILGIAEPLEHFTGPVIGVVRRRDDNEDKLIAAPEGLQLTGEQMTEAVRFVEKYFDRTVESIYDRM